MGEITPARIASELRKIADDVDASRKPSVGLVASEVGRVLLALDGIGVHEEASDPEGSPAVPTGQIIAHLQHWLGAKYAIDVAYRSFADRVRGPWRDSLVDHWQEHSKEERAHAYDLAMRIIGLGGDPAQTVVQVPPCTANLGGFFQVLMKMEKEAIEAGRKTIQMAGDLTSLKVMAENMIVVDTQHLDDLRRMNAQIDLQA
jgi:bacterioferritin (cytochrome b1)